MYYNIFLKTSVHIYSDVLCMVKFMKKPRIRPIEIAELLCTKILCCECDTRDYYILWHTRDVRLRRMRDIKSCKFYDHYILYIINERCICETDSFCLFNVYLQI